MLAGAINPTTRRQITGELLAGQTYLHWLSLLGYTRFTRP
jgi:hypothetical protein